MRKEKTCLICGRKFRRTKDERKKICFSCQILIDNLKIADLDIKEQREIILKYYANCSSKN